MVQRTVQQLVVGVSFIVTLCAAHITNASQDNFEEKALLDLVKNPEIKSVSELISKLPESMRSTFTLIKQSQSLQGSSPEAPRVLMINESRNLIATFNGSPADRGYSGIEVAAFDPTSSRIKYFEIDFAADRTKMHIPLNKDDLFFEDDRVTISKPNPIKCMVCHSANPRDLGSPKIERLARYIWHPYPNWPTSYGSDDDYKFFEDTPKVRAEMATLKKFRESAKAHPRYRNLIFGGSENAPYCDSSTQRDTYNACRKNLLFTAAMGQNQMLQLAQVFVERYGELSAKNYLKKSFRCTTDALAENFNWEDIQLSDFNDIFNKIRPISDPAANLPNVIRYDEKDRLVSVAPWNMATSSIFNFNTQSLDNTHSDESETRVNFDFDRVMSRGHLPAMVIKTLSKSDQVIAKAYTEVMDLAYSKGLPPKGLFARGREFLTASDNYIFAGREDELKAIFCKALQN